MDRLVTFGDENPVVNLQYARRPIYDHPEGISEQAELAIGERPAAISSGVTRYRAEGEGFKRNTLLNERASKELRKLVFGFGDSIVKEDYKNNQTTALSYYVTNEESVQQYKDLDNDIKQSIVEENQNIPATTWSQKNLVKTRILSSFLPFLPNAETNSYWNKSFWTRDLKLSFGTPKFGDSVWNLKEFGFPKDVMQSVTVKPRGWRFGLMNCEPRKESWAINPRRWGQFGDAQRIHPVGANEEYKMIEILEVEEQDLLISEDKFMRKFRPFIDMETNQEIIELYKAYNNKKPEYPSEISEQEALTKIEEFIPKE
jgi:hypothetical protein